jgi:hypothetical protein
MKPKTRRPPNAALPEFARPEGLPFHPHEGESNKAFESFLVYFDIGSNRSFVKVATHTGFGLATSPTLEERAGERRTFK